MITGLHFDKKKFQALKINDYFSIRQQKDKNAHISKYKIMFVSLRFFFYKKKKKCLLAQCKKFKYG